MIRERSPQAFHLYMESNELFQEANDEAKRARKNAQEFMRQQYGSVNPKSLTSKQRNRMKTFLKDQDYNPEDSTVKTDIIDKSTGKPVRVKLDIDGTHPIFKGQPQPFAMGKNKLDEENEDIGTTLRDYMTNYSDTDDKTIAHYDDNNDHIAMPKSIMKRHPSISTGTFKHEEGHINKTYNPEEITKYEGKAQEKIDDTASKGINTNIHDTIPEEYAVDTYSALHNKYPDKTRFLRALASNDISQMKAMKKQCKKQLDDIMSNIDWNGDITELKESFNTMLSTSEDMLNIYQNFIKDMDPSDENYSSMIKVINNFKNNILTYQGIIEKLNNGDIQGSKEDMINNNLPNIKTQLQAAYKELDNGVKMREEFVKEMIKEYANQYQIPVSKVIQEMYQDMFHLYIFQEGMFQESDDLLEPAPVDELTPSETVDTNTSDDGPAPVEAPEEIANDTLSDDTNESIDDINSEIDSSMESEEPTDDALTPPPEENDDDFDLPIPGYMERNLNQTPPPDVSVTSVGDPMTGDYNISNMGMNDSNQQNQYNPEELKILNTLITGEQKMIGTYFDAVKNTNVDVLRRLYGDIGADKAVHQEELMFAKAELTGEPYEPANPDIRNEYQNLLNMGMDESTAMYTAVDKHSVWGGNAALDTMDDSSFAQLEYDLSMLHQISLQNQIIFQLGNECIKNTKDRDHALSVFTESYIMEAMANTTEISDKYTKLPGPLKLIGMAIDGIVKMIKAIREKSIEIIKRLRLKFDKTARFIKNNGISGLFADGVKLYFYSDETNRIDLSEPARYIDLLSFMMQNIAKSMQMQINFDFTLQTENVKNPIRPNNLDDCIAKLKGIIIDKTKVVVDKNNEKLLEREIFGYSEGKLNNGLALQDVDKAIRTSDNAFNRIDILAKTVEQHMTVAKKMFDEMVKLSGQNGSIYHTNRAVYNKCMEAMKFMISKYQMFCNYLTHDLDQLMKLNNGLFEAVKKVDTTEAFTGKKPNIIDDAKTTGSMINPQKEQLQQNSNNPKKKKRLFGK